MAIILTDDGTMDTVLCCTECGEEMRYNYQSGCDDDPELTDEQAYDAFIESCIDDATAEHECRNAEEEEEDTNA